MNKKNHQMTLMERIDFIRANSVTDEQFYKIWGYTREEYEKEVEKWIDKWDEELAKSKPESLK